jgi:hypothetical protein
LAGFGDIIVCMKTTLLALVGLFCLSVAAFAASVDGKWTAEVPGRGGNTMTTTFNFKADGGNLSGTVTTPRGENPIQNGKIDGDNISFDQVMNFNGNEFKISYKGTVKGDAIEMTRDSGRGNPQTFTAKKGQ